MSLILGIHLLERIYLVSDTRRSFLDGRTSNDDLIKAFRFNHRIAAVAAGSAYPASYVLNRLREYVNEETSIYELKKLVQTKLRGFISDYVNTTGNHNGSVALIFGGFDSTKGKLIETSRLGNAMSAMVISAQGRQVNQGVDKRLLCSFGQLSGKKKGDYITVQNIYNAELFSVTFDVRTATISNAESTECFDYVVYHPKQNIKHVQISNEVISLLEFRERSGKSTEDLLYEEAQIVINYVRKVIKDNNFPSVGGHIYPLLQLPEGAIFPTGDMAKIQNGNIVYAGSFYVENGKQMYKLENGTQGEYLQLEDLAKEYITGAETEEMMI